MSAGSPNQPASLQPWVSEENRWLPPSILTLPALWDGQGIDESLQLRHGLFERNEGLVGRRPKIIVVQTGARDQLRFTKGLPRDGYISGLCFLQKKACDGIGLEFYSTPEHDHQIQQVLATVTVADRLLKKGTQLLGSNVFRRADTNHHAVRELHIGPITYGLVEADIQWHHQRTWLFLLDPLPSRSIIRQRVSNPDLNRYEGFVWSRWLPFDLLNPIRHSKVAPRAIQGVWQKFYNGLFVEVSALDGKVKVPRAPVGRPDEVECIASLEDEKAP